MKLSRTVLLVACSLAAVRATAQEPGLDLLEAVRVTLENQPDIRVQKQSVSIAGGVLDLRSGQFDPSLGVSATRLRDEFTLNESDRPAGITNVETQSLVYQAAIRKQFRSGLTVTPNLSLDSTQQNLVGGAQGSPETRGTTGISVTQPLLRGRGSSVTGAAERAARIDVDAAGADLRQTVSFVVLRTVAAYWDYVAATRSLEILRAAEKRFENLIDQGNVMVEADLMPAADLKQVRANLASRRSQRASGEYSLIEARINLGIAMGLSADQAAALPPPSTDFPPVRAEVLPPGAQDAYLRLAEERRDDVRAAVLRRDSAASLLDAARNGLKPQVDLVVSTGWQALGPDSGFSRYFAFNQQTAGPTLSGGLVLDFPFGNRSAKGRYAAQQGTVEQNKILAEDTLRKVRSSVMLTAAQLETSVEQVARSREADELFASAVEDEHEKLRLGTGTVIDLIVTEDRVTQSRLGALNAVVAYAKLLTRLRYETGTLAPTGEATIDLATLTSAPAVDAR